jgi:hypothetical protein
LTRAGDEKTVMTLLTNSAAKQAKSKAECKGHVNSSNKYLKCDHCNKTGHFDSIRNIGLNLPKSKQERVGTMKRRNKNSQYLRRSERRRPIIPTIDAVSEHFSPHRHLFQTYTEFMTPAKIITMEHTYIQGIGKDKTTIYAYDNGVHLNSTM